jgi:hypothetical protein
MYAAVMYLRFDPQLAPLAASAFVDKLLPRVKAAAGFGEGTWLDPSDGEGLGFKLFDPQEQAHEASAPRYWQAPGATIEQIEMGPVAAIA